MTYRDLQRAVSRILGAFSRRREIQRHRDAGPEAHAGGVAAARYANTGCERPELCDDVQEGLLRPVARLHGLLHIRYLLPVLACRTTAQHSTAQCSTAQHGQTE